MADSVENGLILMAAGIGTVFVVLATLVWLVGLVSRVSRWLEPTPVATAMAPASGAAAPRDDELIGVIGAAVKAHRDGRRPGPPRSP